MKVKLSVRLPVHIALKHAKELEEVPDIVSRIIDWDLEKIGRGPVIGDYILMFSSKDAEYELYKQVANVYIVPGAEHPVEAMIVLEGPAFFCTVHRMWKKMEGYVEG